MGHRPALRTRLTAGSGWRLAIQHPAGRKTIWRQRMNRRTAALARRTPSHADEAATRAWLATLAGHEAPASDAELHTAATLRQVHHAQARAAMARPSPPERSVRLLNLLEGQQLAASRRAAVPRWQRLWGDLAQPVATPSGPQASPGAVGVRPLASAAVLGVLVALAAGLLIRSPAGGPFEEPVGGWVKGAVAPSQSALSEAAFTAAIASPDPMASALALQARLAVMGVRTDLTQTNDGKLLLQAKLTDAPNPSVREALREAGQESFSGGRLRLTFVRLD
jgi:hypothetical protein